MDSSSKQFYLCEEDLPQMSSIEIVIENESQDGSFTGPAALLPDSYDYTETQLSYYACNDCMTGAITPESKNSSNASLISSNSNAREYSTLQTIMEITIPGKIDSPISSPFDVSINREEALLTTSIQVFIAFMIAGFGNVGAGLILDHVQHWTVFMSITEMFVLVPSLLGLKGNLEMTMAARLSTHANLGNMQDLKLTLKLAKGNIALVQCQATVVSFLAALVAIVWSIPNGINLNNCLILIASSLITANVACFALGLYSNPV
jgi:cation transporter-like permease